MSRFEDLLRTKLPDSFKVPIPENTNLHSENFHREFESGVHNGEFIPLPDDTNDEKKNFIDINMPVGTSRELSEVYFFHGNKRPKMNYANNSLYKDSLLRINPEQDFAKFLGIRPQFSKYFEYIPLTSAIFDAGNSLLTQAKKITNIISKDTRELAITTFLTNALTGGPKLSGGVVKRPPDPKQQVFGGANNNDLLVQGQINFMEDNEELWNRGIINPVKPKDPIDRNTDMVAHRAYDNYRDKNLTVKIDSILRKGVGNLNSLIDRPGVTTRSRLLTWDLSDSSFWGITVYAHRPATYDDNGVKTGGFSNLPQFPKAFDTGWWPVSSASYNQTILKSKDFVIPHATITIPEEADLSSDLQLVVVDNASMDLNYWLWNYNLNSFDAHNNFVFPYKTLVLEVGIYQYDRSYQQLFQETLLCSIKNFTSTFVGSAESTADEYTIDLSILGKVI